MIRMRREIALDVCKAIGVSLAGAAMVVASFVLVLVLPVIGSLLAFVSILIADIVAGYGVMRVALSIVVTSLASWLFQLSFGSLLLAWIVATIIGACIGGFVGSFLGSLSATVVLHRVSARDDVDLGA
jgi:hypothetical protein